MLFIMLSSQCLIVEKVVSSATQSCTVIPIPLNRCILWHWKRLYSLTGDDIFEHLHVLCHLMPQILYRAKPSVNPRDREFQRPHPFHYFSPCCRYKGRKSISIKIHQRHRKDNHSPQNNEYDFTYPGLQFLFLPLIFQSSSSRLSSCGSFSTLPIWLITPLTSTTHSLRMQHPMTYKFIQDRDYLLHCGTWHIVEAQ